MQNFDIRLIALRLKQPAFVLVLMIWVLVPAFQAPLLAAEDNASRLAQLQTRALIRASQRIEYRSEIVAPVAKADFLVGQRFVKGDALIVFDCSRYEAELEAAQANANAASIEHRTKQRLLRYQAAGKNEVALAAAQSAKAGAELEVQFVRNRSCLFTAPFSGRVVELNARPHEFPPSDRPLIVVINDQALEMELVVPSNWLVWVRVGSVFAVKIDETKSTGTGIVERIAAEVDPVSQTVKLIAKFREKPSSVLAGMSGTVRFANSPESPSLN